MSVPAYPAYRDSGVAWLGPLPRGWAVKRVKHVTRGIEQGWSPQCDGFPVASADEWGVLKVGCVNGGRFNPEENKALPAELAPLPELGIAAGDVLISRANTRELVGGAVCVSADHPNLLLCDKLYRLRLNDTACAPQWLAVYLRSDAARGQIELAASGASQSMVNIGQGTILDLPMPLPMRDEQSMILAFLDRETGKIDALVAEQERLIALLKEKRQAVISQAVTKGLDASAPMKDSGVAWLGQVPAHWEVKRLKRLVRFVSGGTPSKEREDFWVGDIPWVSPKDMKKWVVTGESDAITAEAVAASNLVLVPAQIVLIVVRGMILAHSFPVALSGRALTINQDMKALLPERGIVAEYLAYYLAVYRDAVAEFIDEAGHGTRVLRMDGFAGLKVAVPTVGEQRQIAEFIGAELGKSDTLTTEAHRAIALLRERRAALISAAVTGKIDVRGLAAATREGIAA